MNKVVLIGRLTATPVCNQTKVNNVNICQFSIAVNRKFKDSNGNKVTDFIDCVAWKQQAEFIGNYLTQGQLVSIIGTLQIERYQRQDGTYQKKYQVIVEEIQSLGSNNNLPKEEKPKDIYVPVVPDDIDKLGSNEDYIIAAPDPFMED